MDLAEDYRRWWPTVERSNAWLVADGNRRIRFRGAEKNRLGHSLRIAAINLRRLVNLNGPRRRMAAQVSLKSDAQARVVKKGTAPWALPTWVADFNPFVSALRSDILPACGDQSTPKIRVFQQSPGYVGVQAPS